MVQRCVWFRGKGFLGLWVVLGFIYMLRYCLLFFRVVIHLWHSVCGVFSLFHMCLMSGEKFGLVSVVAIFGYSV